ncbi:ABC transporter permease [Dietzia aerolata]|uniref:FtsX-like permease family protein n=1 Tax=Dietzia aerolata TaxID=595984 RepID=A0ABV5JXB0_9ACTN|nr:ABC transporter permease [Dietzia aerolata]MBB0969136.1 ABC transporter permease [Dietzia aerolata]
MFFALRDLRTARWRFALITGVVLLLSVLVAGLLGLTAGLTNQSVSALRALGSGGASFVLPADESGPVDLDRASLTAEQIEAVTDADPSAVPVGIARITVDDGTETGVSAVAVGLGAPVGSLVPPSGGEVLVSSGLAEEFDDDDNATIPAASAGEFSGSDAALTGPGSSAGDSLGVSGQSLAVAGDAGDLWHSHTPVLLADLDTWRELAPRGGAATAIAVSSDAVNAAASSGADTIGALTGAGSGLAVADGSELESALPSHRAEQTSLNTMTYMLLAVTALVVGAFFAVWGMQRRREVAILKALGASTATVVRDSLGQAAIVLAVGVGGGVALVALLGSAIGGAVPFVVSASTTLTPALLLAGLGIVGAAVTLRPVVTADPTTALGAAR